MKLFIMFVTLAVLAALCSAQPVDTSAPQQLETTGVLRIKRSFIAVGRCPPGFIKTKRGLCEPYEIITFGLACILCAAVVFGLAIAIIAGIAYGYNYSMAEFITFTRSDVTVFMRRGQFYDKESQNFRRSGAEDLFSGNSSTDYEDHKPPAKGKQLADTWLKTQDTRKYAEVLTRYNPENAEIRESPTVTQMPSREVYLKPSPPAGPIISVVPNLSRYMPTETWRSGSSEIKMRNFQPLQEFATEPNRLKKPESLFPSRPVLLPSVSILNSKEKDDSLSKVEMRFWGTTARAVISDEPYDVDEDNIEYKPV